MSDDADPDPFKALGYHGPKARDRKMTSADLRDWAKTRNLTQAAIGELLHRSPRQMRRWFSGAPIPHWVEDRIRAIDDEAVRWRAS